MKSNRKHSENEMTEAHYLNSVAVKLLNLSGRLKPSEELVRRMENALEYIIKIFSLKCIAFKNIENE